jgi:uncharacterized protein YbjT (DUF2867 family)
MLTLVTGGTGHLGRPVVDLLRESGHEARVLSRRAGRGHAIGDLTTGAGLTEALDGVDTVLHLATNRRRDLDATRRLLDAAREAGIRHVIFISIVGVDRIPYAYYRDKVAIERMIAESGVPFTVLRATQFHSFVPDFLELQRRLPVTLVLPVPVQPIAEADVAARLVELATGEPAGRVADVGGPEILSMRRMAELWQARHGIRKPIRTLRLPGRLVAAFRAGHHLAGLPGVAGQPYGRWLEAQPGRGR